MKIAIIQAVSLLFEIIEFLILVRCILSWFPLGENVITRFVYMMTEPILGPIRNMMQKSPLGGASMIDFSPVLAIILLSAISNIIMGILL